MNTVRGSLIYTAFATTVFLGIQWIDDVRDPVTLGTAAVMFFLFTFFMLRLIQRVMSIVVKGAGPRRRDAGREPGPAVIEATTDRPEHARKRREARRRRR
ncbi:MAG: hypothetical protein AB7F65_01300 [Dehalococcoidia bacterium]